MAFFPSFFDNNYTEADGWHALLQDIEMIFATAAALHGWVGGDAMDPSFPRTSAREVT